MSLPETEPHISAVMAQLRAQLPTKIKVELGVAPAVPKPPFAVVYPDAGDVDTSRLAMDYTDIRIRFMVHAVGAGPEQCMWTMDKVRNALLGERIDVPGRVTQRMTQTLGPQPMTRDQSLQPPVYLTVAEFRIQSQNEASHD